MPTPKNSRRTVLLVGLLIGVTFILYAPMLRYPFVGIDDRDYIYENSQVQSGVTVAGVIWAFTTGHVSNWHPITWISHMLDCQLFGLNSGGHHFTNLLFHITNTVLLFFLLRQMTGSQIRSGVVAALFAWHPLHVESVAWVSERKDVLCVFFALLATMAYVRFAREGGRRFYALALGLFALGLMSKPMLVTFPFVLLLLDVWPLQRLNADSAATVRTSGRKLFLEKLPFFLLTLASCVVTYLAQLHGGAVSSLEVISPLLRVENVAISYARYVLKTVWPVNLAVVYPYPESWPAIWVGGAVVLLLLISTLAIHSVRRRPYVLIGWLWFLGTLVPTIGLVQVGAQAMADRYMYIPAIGLFIALVWWLHELCTQTFPRLRGPVISLGGVTLVACVLLTREQLSDWRSSEALFQHAIGVTEENYIALNGLGNALTEAGRYDGAYAMFQASVRLKPRYPEGNYNLGTELLRRGAWDEAATHFRRALADHPKLAQAHNNLGLLLFRQGKFAEAESEYVQAIALEPDKAERRYNLATMQMGQGRLSDAVTNLMMALHLKPDYALAHGNLGVALMQLGQVEQGTQHLTEAARLEPQNSESQRNLGVAFLDQGRPAEAQKCFARALELNPAEPKLLYGLGLSLARQKKFGEAVAQFQAAVQGQPDYPEALNELAWVAATNPDAGLRNGRDAVRQAERACDLTGRKLPGLLLTLAAAYAESSRFSEARAIVGSARELAAQSGNVAEVERADLLGKCFAADQPFRE